LLPRGPSSSVSECGSADGGSLHFGDRRRPHGTNVGRPRILRGAREGGIGSCAYRRGGRWAKLLLFLAGLHLLGADAGRHAGTRFELSRSLVRNPIRTAPPAALLCGRAVRFGGLY